jgi:hypothetical protein
MSYRKADIYVNKTKAGILEKTDFGYRFGYDSGAECWIRIRTSLGAQIRQSVRWAWSHQTEGQSKQPRIRFDENPI